MSEVEKKMENPVESKPETPAVAANAAATPAELARKRRRKIRIFAGILLGLLLFAMIFNLIVDQVIAGAVRSIAPMVTGTRVELKSVKTNLLSGRLELNGFVVGNPEGFSSPDALAMKHFHCQLAVGSLLSDKIIVEEVVIEGMQAVYEPKMGGSNLDAIQRNVDKFSGKKEGAEAKPADDKKADKPAKKVVIRQLVVKDLTLGLTTLSVPMTLPMPDITMNDLGEDSDLAAVTKEFFSKLMSEVAGAVTNIDFKGAADSVGSGLKKAVDNVTEGISKAFK